METYKDDPCKLFGVRELTKESQHDKKTNRLIAQMHKAITIIQFKEEAKIINRHPEFGMDNRKLLEGIIFDRGTCLIDGTEYDMLDTFLPTVQGDNPIAITVSTEVIPVHTSSAKSPVPENICKTSASISSTSIFLQRKSWRRNSLRTSSTI